MTFSKKIERFFSGWEGGGGWGGILYNTITLLLVSFKYEVYFLRG